MCMCVQLVGSRNLQRESVRLDGEGSADCMGLLHLAPTVQRAPGMGVWLYGRVRVRVVYMSVWVYMCMVYECMCLDGRVAVWACQGQGCVYVCMGLYVYECMCLDGCMGVSGLCMCLYGFICV